MSKKKMLENEAVEEVRYYVFVKRGCRYFPPQYLTAGEADVKWIFCVPVDNSVGILDGVANGVSLLKFGGFAKDPEREATAAQDYGGRIYDMFKYRFGPSCSEDSVVYAQDRAAVIANLKTGDAVCAEYDVPPDGFITGISFLNPQENLFAVVKSVDNGGGYDDNLHTAVLDGGRFADTGWIMHIGQRGRAAEGFPLYNPCVVHGNKLFVYNGRDIICSDGRKSVPHPLPKVFNRNFGHGARLACRLKDFALHPEQPFAVVIEEYAPADRLVLIRWDKSNPAADYFVFGPEFERAVSSFKMKRAAFAYMSFSPDGNWLAVGCVSPDAPKDPHFIAVPIDMERAQILRAGDLAVLGQVKGMTSLAWTREPAALVVSDGELLHKWDLDELQGAREFAAADGGSGKKKFILGKIGGLFRGKK